MINILGIVLTIIIIVLSLGTLILVYLVYRMMLKAKFYSGVALASTFMVDRLLRNIGRLYSPSINTPDLLDKPDNNWLREIVISNITYSVVSTLLFLALLWVLIDISKRIRYVQKKEIKHVENVEAYKADITIPEVDNKRDITIVKENKKDE